MTTTITQPLSRFFLVSPNGHETCFYVQPNRELTATELERLKWMLGSGPLGAKQITTAPSILIEVCEIGPKGVMIPPVSTNLAHALQEAGIPIDMIKMSRRVPKNGQTIPRLDHMLEEVYTSPLLNFQTASTPLATYSIPFMERGQAALEALNVQMGFGWYQRELEAISKLCRTIGRNPTVLEMVGIAQATSEHCSHGFFNAQMIFDDILQKQTLFQMVKEPLALLEQIARARCAIAFSDNAAGIKVPGVVPMLITTQPGFPSEYCYQPRRLIISLKVETHNHPSMVCPEPGIATGVGGCVRDSLAVGRGGIPTAILVTIYAGRLNIPGYDMPGEKTGKSHDWQYSDRFATGVSQFTDGMHGGAHFGNASGIPTLMYHPDSVGVLDSDGARREFIKPVAAAGLLGWLDASHTQKHDQKPGMLVIALGGAAFNIGFNGGAGSSDPTGSSTAKQDQGSVQRGNPFVQHGIQEVFNSCIALGHSNPLESAHDQGAGGMSVVGFEIGDTGVRYELRRVNVGDATMSAVEIFCCEYQERVFVLVKPENAHILEGISAREGVNLEILGVITGDGKFVVTDENDESTPVDLPIADVKQVSQKMTYHDETVLKEPQHFAMPNISVLEMARCVFQLVSVGSSKHGLNTMDSWVGGKTVVNQRVGPLQLSVSQFGVLAASFDSFNGGVVAQASQHLALLVDEENAIRLTLATVLGNIVFTHIQGGLSGVFGSVNWCWDAKQPGEACRMYQAMKALKDAVITLKGATPHCGKDSLSLGVVIGKERVKSPGVCLLTMHGAVADVRKTITADIKSPGTSRLGWINLSSGVFRMGGSGLAHACDSIGDLCPDVDMEIFAKTFAAMQILVKNHLILAGHNTAEHGLLVSLFKMGMAGNCGFDVTINHDEKALFAHEAGFVIEYLDGDLEKIRAVLKELGVAGFFTEIGTTTSNQDAKENLFEIRYGPNPTGKKDISIPTHTACGWYETTSDVIEGQQLPAEIAKAQATDPYRFVTPCWRLVRSPSHAKQYYDSDRPRVAILRASGSNGHHEMAAMCMKAGMMPVDIHINDLIKGDTTLDAYSALFLVGGFADGDAGGSAIGWAGRMKFNEKVKSELTKFRARPNTMIYGVCNGNQAGVLLGLVPGDALLQEKPDICFDIAMSHNDSGRFEARVVYVRVEGSPAIMLGGMQGSVLPAIAAHGEGKYSFATPEALKTIEKAGLVALRYCLPNGELAGGRYPWNPNGSPNDIAGVTDVTGRTLLTMPHLERFTAPEMIPWIPPVHAEIDETPWLPIFENAGDHLRPFINSTDHEPKQNN